MTNPVAETLKLVEPRFVPPLDPGFRPAVLANRAFAEAVAQSGAAVPLVLGLERANGQVSRFETTVFADDHPDAASNLPYAERIVKFLLWQRGGWRVYAGGPAAIGDHLRSVYAADGERAFDFHFMGEDVYEHEFTVVTCAAEDVPAENEGGKALGRHLDGCRIGFDLGASDRKVSAVVDGEPIFSEEVVWEPKKHADPDYHYREVKAAIETAASKLPRVDAIGGSSAGIYVDNRAMIASLFRAIPKDDFGGVREMFLRLQDEFGVPLEIINDGDVTALAGAMSLEDDAVLGIAMGSSLAAGYVSPDGTILGWLNELAFAPVDYAPGAAVDEWSQDAGVGAPYFSQQCVFRLAHAAGIDVPEDVTDAEKLKLVQNELEAGHEGARRIWETIGTYLGYAVAHYADFYAIRHMLILGRVTSGSGGEIILERAREVLASEFPELSGINIQLPDEKSRRVGQSIAAASLPAIA
jgi:predicted NBD/HSP70 family sugar kinase